METSAPTIRQIGVWPVDIPLTDPFVISQGSMAIAETLYVRVTLEDGHHGYGEIAPFAALTGETRELSLAATQKLIPRLIGQPIDRYRRLSQTMPAREPRQPAARCGLETALLDACARWLGIPLWALWGGKQAQTRQTDVTLPLLDTPRTLALADHWRQRGFKTLKLKVGGNLDREINLVRELARQHPDIDFIFDANQGFTRDEALRFIRAPPTRVVRCGYTNSPCLATTWKAWPGRGGSSMFRWPPTNLSLPPGTRWPSSRPEQPTSSISKA